MPFVKVSSSVQVHYLVPSCLDHTDVIDHTKPTVVLLHPRFFDSYFFTPQYRDARLARAYNLVTLDHHYHGRTQSPLTDKPYDFKAVARDMLAAMTALKLTKAHIFGDSLGSQIAVVMQTLAPDRVLSLILCGLLPENETEENLEQYRFLRDACYEKADDGSDRLPSDVVHGLHWIYFGEDHKAQNLIDEWVATSNFKPSNRKLITKIFSSVLDRKPIDPKLWAAIECPVLILHGEHDVACSEDVVQDIFAMIKKADKELQIIPLAPHFLSYTHPLQINTYAADFLDRITGIDSKAAANGTVEIPISLSRPNIQSTTTSKKTSFLKRLL